MMECIMKEEKITRTYLETLSFSDLVTLADDYGVDVPDDLDRRFLIAELLELAEESENEEEMEISTDKDSHGNHALTGNYNETQISCILRNPAWLFVFWNISNQDNEKIEDAFDGALRIRICILKGSDDPSPKEVIEVQCSSTSQEQYVLIPKDAQFIKAELILSSGANSEVLAFSPIVAIPHSPSLINDLQVGQDCDFPEIIKLSGIDKLLKDQYKNHRHSFS